MSPAEPVAEQLDRVAFRAGESESGIGAVVLEHEIRDDGTHVWECIAGDGQEWHFIPVIGVGLGPFQNLAPEVVEEGVERFAATLPADNRLYRLVNFSPLHIDADGHVDD